MAKFEKIFTFVSLVSIAIFTVVFLIVVILSPYENIPDTLYKLLLVPCAGFFVGSATLPTVFLWLFWNILFPIAILGWLIYWVIYYPIKRFITWAKSR
jgi:hypothetical protein